MFGKICLSGRYDVLHSDCLWFGTSHPLDPGMLTLEFNELRHQIMCCDKHVCATHLLFFRHLMKEEKTSWRLISDFNMEYLSLCRVKRHKQPYITKKLYIPGIRLPNLIILFEWRICRNRQHLGADRALQDGRGLILVRYSAVFFFTAAGDEQEGRDQTAD